jgi:hypothetical protein
MALNLTSNLTLPDHLANLNERLKIVEDRFSELGYDTRALVSSEVKKRWKVEPQATTMFGLYMALCINTVDPWKQNRVQYYSPMTIRPNSPIKELPWAEAISPQGGFDDSGCNWVPPAGSMLCMIHEQGFRGAAYYFGTTWTRDRGPDGKHNFNFNVEEYYDIYEGHRKGYNVGPNDGSQVLPSWNTESYNGPDIDNITQFEQDTQAQKKITAPNIYGWKTPEKHMEKWVDGDYKCNRRWKRMERLSGGGNWMIFKDDHMHPSGQWAHPDCNCGGGDVTDCKSNPDKDCENPKDKPKCANPNYKHQNECRPYKGPGTPQNNKAALDQSGIQMLTIGGASFVMDDSVDQPRGKPTWERSLQSFDFGCNDKTKARMDLISQTGHRITLNDDETDTNIRSDINGIKLLTATGNRIQLNDHTVRKTGEGGDLVAGAKRGIELESTSTHIIQMIDEENEQKSPDRQEGGQPVNKAKKAYIRVRTGYGLQILMNDRANQEETDRQFIEIWSPQWNNTQRGSHVMKMQEVKEGPGLIFLRAGGNYLIQTYDNMLDIVGEEENPSDKITIVSKDYITDVKKLYFNHAETHFFFAEDKIFLAAGRDCHDDKTDTDGPCLYNVVINRCPIPCPLVPYILHFTPGRSTSERVFASGYSSKTVCP